MKSAADLASYQWLENLFTGKHGLTEGKRQARRQESDDLDGLLTASLPVHSRIGRPRERRLKRSPKLAREQEARQMLLGLRPGSQRERYRQISNLNNDLKNSCVLAVSSGVSHSH